MPTDTSSLQTNILCPHVLCFYFSSTCHSNTPLWFENYGIIISTQGLSIFTALNVYSVAADLRRGSFAEARGTTLIVFSMLLSIITGNVRLWKTQGCLILGFGIVHAILCIIVRLGLLFVCIKNILCFLLDILYFQTIGFFEPLIVLVLQRLSFRISNINMTLTKINPGHLNIWCKPVLIK